MLKKTAEAEKNKILDNGKKQSDMKYQQIISEAKMNARRAELGAKEEVIEAAFAKATEDLKAKASSDDAEYSESLIKMIEAIGGAILKTRNGDIEVNNTIESRLDRFKGLLRSEVANVLFKN